MAIGASATEHTRHLLGIGLARSGEQSPLWWFGPQGLSVSQTKSLHAAVQNRLKLRSVWRVPSTFTADAGQDRLLLCMLEPLSSPQEPGSGVLGVFDVQPMLADFFSSGLARRHPVQVLDGEQVLYQSNDWRAPSDQRPGPITAQASLNMDSLRWAVVIQPGHTRLVQALSLATLFVVGLSLLAGLGIIAIAWMLVARTWILEQAVTRRTASLRKALVRLRQLATTDDLTGLHNRRFFFARWASEYDRAKRYQRPLACLMVDVTGFKQVNDRLGHLAGDRLLKRVADELKRQCRQSDVVARIGGDEFIIALPETDLTHAQRVTRKLRKIEIALMEDSATLPPVRLSIGVAGNTDPSHSAQDIIQAADSDLYADKRRARGEASAAQAAAPLPG
jgi:diguanylate cyclase (GGDEF)-like protein